MTTITKHLQVENIAPQHLAIGAWILSMIALPIMRWIWGDDIIPFASTMGVIFQFGAVVFILLAYWGMKQTIRTIAIVAILTWGAEYIGSHTGLIFGEYTYTEALQPQIIGVPLLIPLAWLMMLAPSWAIATMIVGKDISTPLQRLKFIIISALAMTAWDLYLDPQMVTWGFWVWANEGAYFGIPLVNYLGWFIVSALVTFVINPRNIPITPLLVIYMIVWIFQAIGLGLFWGQPGPALFGFVGMGILIVTAIISWKTA